MNTYLQYLIIWVVTFVTMFIAALILTFNLMNSLYIALIVSVLAIIVSLIVIWLLSKIRLYYKSMNITYRGYKWTTTEFENAGIVAALVFMFSLFAEMAYHGGTMNYDNFLMSFVPAAISAITTFATKLGIQLPPAPTSSTTTTTPTVSAETKK